MMLQKNSRSLGITVNGNDTDSNNMEDKTATDFILTLIDRYHVDFILSCLEVFVSIIFIIILIYILLTLNNISHKVNNQVYFHQMAPSMAARDAIQKRDSTIYDEDYERLKKKKAPQPTVYAKTVSSV